MTELIKVTTNENDEQLVSARELYESFSLKIRFSLWWSKNNDGLVEGEDFSTVSKDTQLNQHGGLKKIKDYALTLDTAKHLAMQSKTEKGREIRSYFIKVEKAWNNPEMVVQRALQIQTRKVEQLKIENNEMKPKARFADAVDASHTSILIGDLAKIISQNGIKIGQNRLFHWLRENGYLIKRKGESFNMPTQRSAEMGLIEIKERTHANPDGSIRISRTPKVTGKGQIYFVNKFLEEFND